MIQLLFWLLLLPLTVAAAALDIYQVLLSDWNGDRARDLPLFGDVMSQSTNVQLLQCAMQLSRTSKLGQNECLVFQTASSTPCFIGTLNTQLCKNLQSLGSYTNGSIKIWASNLAREDDCTVMQHRVSDSVSFYRNWSEYARGFGEGPNGNYWLGLENIYKMTSVKARVLYIEVTQWDGTRHWVTYSNFKIASASDKYRLTSVGSFYSNSSKFGDCLTTRGLNMQFSTFDSDNDDSSGSCSIIFKGGWWYESCLCTNPNGLYFYPPNALNTSSYADGVVWNNYFGYHYSMKEFKIILV